MTYHTLTLSNDINKRKYNVTTDNYKHFLKKFFSLDVLDVKINPFENKLY